MTSERPAFRCWGGLGTGWRWLQRWASGAYTWKVNFFLSYASQSVQYRPCARTLFEPPGQRHAATPCGVSKASLRRRPAFPRCGLCLQSGRWPTERSHRAHGHRMHVSVKRGRAHRVLVRRQISRRQVELHRRTREVQACICGARLQGRVGSTGDDEFPCNVLRFWILQLLAGMAASANMLWSRRMRARCAALPQERRGTGTSSAVDAHGIAAHPLAVLSILKAHRLVGLYSFAISSRISPAATGQRPLKPSVTSQRHTLLLDEPV